MTSYPPAVGVLRFIWSGVLAFDRIGGRFPYLVQIWLLELFLTMSTAFFVGQVVDVRGCCGVEGTHDGIPAELWGCLLVALVLAFFFVRGLVRPRTFEGSWGPHRFTLPTSHPSFALLLLLTLPIPLLMVLATQREGDSVFYVRASGWAGLVMLAVLALARVVTWLVRRPHGHRTVRRPASRGRRCGSPWSRWSCSSTRSAGCRSAGWRGRSTARSRTCRSPPPRRPSTSASTTASRAGSSVSRSSGRRTAPAVAATTSPAPGSWSPSMAGARRCCSPSRCR